MVLCLEIPKGSVLIAFSEEWQGASARTFERGVVIVDGADGL